MEKRVTEVRAHERSGRAVAAHRRTTPQSSGEATQMAPPPHPDGLKELSGDSIPWDIEEKFVWLNETNFNKGGRVEIKRVVSGGKPIGVVVHGFGDKVHLTAGMPASENPTASHPLLFHSVDYSGMSLNGYQFFFRQAESLAFDGAQLDGATFHNRQKTRSGFLRTSMFLSGCTFTGASLRGADLRDATLRACNFVGADLTDADLSGVTAMGRGVDFTDSNITADQFDSLGRSRDPIVYRRYNLDDAAAALGMDNDEVALMAWAGELDVRDNETLQRIEGRFDAERHHIPQWAVQQAQLIRRPTDQV